MNTLTTVIPVFNGETYIAATLASLAEQTIKPERVIVLDNRSTDATEKIVRQFGPVKCEWIQNESNLGLFGNSNRALAFAEQTTFLHLLHADDLLHPEFYKRSMAALKEAPGRALSFCIPEFIDGNSDPLGRSPLSPPPAMRVISSSQFISERSELRPIYFVGVLLKTDGRPSPCNFRTDLPQIADHVFWAEWARHCSLIVELPEQLAKYRFYTGSETSRNLQQLQSWVLDEWRAMDSIAQMLDQRGLRRWIHVQKLKTLFAARSYVKMKQVRNRSPEFAADIRRAACHISKLWRYLLAVAVVELRDFISLSSRMRKP